MGKKRLLWALLLTLTALSLLMVAKWRDITIRYHFSAMENAYSDRYGDPEPWGAMIAQPFDEGADTDYAHHRDKLMSMGEIVEIKFVCRHLQYPSPESRHFFGQLMESGTHPEFIDWESDQNTDVAVPMNITVWCLPKDEEDWRQYIATRDTPSYKANFVEADTKAE